MPSMVALRFNRPSACSAADEHHQGIWSWTPEHPTVAGFFHGRDRDDAFDDSAQLRGEGRLADFDVARVADDRGIEIGARPPAGGAGHSSKSPPYSSSPSNRIRRLTGETPRSAQNGQICDHAGLVVRGATSVEPPTALPAPRTVRVLLVQAACWLYVVVG